jgi:flavodoxin/ferredoxin
MKCIIVYLSVTGNTEKIAKAIQAGIQQAAGHCDITTLKEANWHRLGEYDLIGFGCPPMDGHIETPNFSSFINDMRFVGGKHAFVFASHGTHPEYIFPSMIPKLQKRGLTVIGMHNCYAPCYLSIFPWPYITDGHPDRTDLDEAASFGNEMVLRSRRISAGEKDLIPPVPEAPHIDPEQEKEMARQMEEDRKRGKLSYPMSFPVLRKFHKELCTYPECRLCMDNCPVDGIDLSVTPQVIGKPCVGCTFCAKICPTGAMDESAWVAVGAPQLAERMQFYIKGVEAPEAEGKFRRLLPVGEIGADTPVYKVFNKHPQWIIGKGFNK